MSLINSIAKEMHIKLVYYGPSLSGKTTNVKWVYQHSQAKDKSKLFNLPGDIERTVMFDFLPLDYGDVRGLRTRFHLYAVPGQVEYDPRRRLALTGIDGVVFVADSQPERMEENIASVNNLRQNLELQGWNIQEIPLVFQYNKRDLPNAVPVAELRTALNRYNAPDFEAVASTGAGVREAFHTISKTIINVLKGGDL